MRIDILFWAVQPSNSYFLFDGVCEAVGMELSPAFMYLLDYSMIDCFLLDTALRTEKILETPSLPLLCRRITTYCQGILSLMEIFRCFVTSFRWFQPIFLLFQFAYFWVTGGASYNSVGRSVFFRRKERFAVGIFQLFFIENSFLSNGKTQLQKQDRKNHYFLRFEYLIQTIQLIWLKWKKSDFIPVILLIKNIFVVIKKFSSLIKFQEESQPYSIHLNSPSKNSPQPYCLLPLYLSESIIMALLSDQSHRHHPLSTQQLIRQTWPMGFISYGGPLAHIGLFRQKFVTQLKWIDDDRFNELTAICQSVPGPTSTQLMISLATYMTESVWGGVLAFLLFFGPSFVVMCVAGMFLSSVEIPKIVNELLSGFKCAAVAVVLQAFWGLSKKYREQNDSVILFTLCAVVYFLIPSITCMFFLFLISTLYCLKFKQISIQKPSKQANSKSFDSIVFGKFSALLFFVLVIVSSFVRGTGSVVGNQMAIFYRIGSVIIGGGHVILPMMWTEFSQFGYFTESAFWNGFSIVSCLPGPMFNMAAYVGVLINGFVGAVCCCLALYTPSFLTIWAVLPYWQLYRTNERIQQVIYGLCCASIGFILAAVAMLWQAACIEENSVWHTMVNTAIAMAAYYFLEWKKVPIPYVIFGGGVKFLIKELLFSR